MNIEAMYIKASRIETVANIVNSYLQKALPDLGSQASAPLPSSYDQLLRNEAKRKIVLSKPLGEWCYLIESKEVVDFTLASVLSETLHTSVLIVQISVVTGARGFAVLEEGKVIMSDFSENDEAPEKTILEFLNCNGIKSELLMFKEAVQNQKDGWLLLHPQK